MKLSPHFAASEFAVSSSRPDLVTPPSEWPDGIAANLARLCAGVLEPMRDLLGGPLVVTSGYRSDALNMAIGGSRTSQHRLGEAADVRCPGEWDSVDAVRHVWEASQVGGYPQWDQLIAYHPRRGGHMHVSFTARRKNRREVLVMMADGRYLGGTEPDVIDEALDALAASWP